MPEWTEDAFRAAWDDRESRIYPALFGKPADKGILVPTPEMFAQFRCKELDPRWLHVGTIVHEPTPARGTWVHVTSGLTNAWWDDDEPGLGAEFVMETPADEPWATTTMTRLACYEILLAHGHYPGREGIVVGDRLPLWDPPRPTRLSHILVCPPPRGPEAVDTGFGRIELLHMVGITPEERQHAVDHGDESLLARMRGMDWFPATRLDRESCV